MANAPTLWRRPNRPEPTRAGGMPPAGIRTAYTHHPLAYRRKFGAEEPPEMG
ncbi:hypothetical protein [Streptomyces sp. NPDC017435]|uniref:hypothetical protein n=1 Tax=Streptomyces sp. NPDC017435 TaxID=3364995 RepID=UPI0037A21406